MSMRLYRLVTGVTAGVAAIADAVVVYLQPVYAVQIAAAIPIVAGCITEVCSLFLKQE